MAFGAGEFLYLGAGDFAGERAVADESQRYFLVMSFFEFHLESEGSNVEVT